MYKALVARANYLAQDRSDIVFAVKELSRSMSAPTIGDMKALKRLSRYLLGRERESSGNIWVPVVHQTCRCVG